MKVKELISWQDKGVKFIVRYNETTALIIDNETKKEYHIAYEWLKEQWWSGKNFIEVTDIVFDKKTTHNYAISANAWNTIEFLIEEWNL